MTGYSHYDMGRNAGIEHRVDALSAGVSFGLAVNPPRSASPYVSSPAKAVSYRLSRVLKKLYSVDGYRSDSYLSKFLGFEPLGRLMMRLHGCLEYRGLIAQ